MHNLNDFRDFKGKIIYFLELYMPGGHGRAQYAAA